jgi:hypothetical protein
LTTHKNAAQDKEVQLEINNQGNAEWKGRKNKIQKNPKPFC